MQCPRPRHKRHPRHPENKEGHFTPKAIQPLTLKLVRWLIPGAPVSSSSHAISRADLLIHPWLKTGALPEDGGCFLKQLLTHKRRKLLTIAQVGIATKERSAAAGYQGEEFFIHGEDGVGGE